MSQILEREVEYSDLSIVDPVGRLFRWRGGIYRGIYSDRTDFVRDLFTSGFLDTLIEEGLFPRSRITDYALEGYGFVVQHEAIIYPTYPHEWSFDMLRDAGRAVLRIVEIATRFGWDLKDGHPYNMLFSNARPVYVDLGSFERKRDKTGFVNGLDFVRLYWRPLLLWSLGDAFVARRLISSANAEQPDISWWHYRNPLLSGLGHRLNRRLATGHAVLLAWLGRIMKYGKEVARFFPDLASRLPAEIIARNPDLLRRKLERLKLPPPDLWDDYHSEYLKDGQFAVTPRFQRVLGILRNLDCDSVVELGGNQGLFTLYLARETPIRRFICADSSSSAVNRLYRFCRDRPDHWNGRTVQPAVHDFMLPEWSAREVHPAERFRSDAVVLLAVTHHLVLSQNFSIREIFRIVATYTNQYALVEFMPKGLWDGKNDTYVPPWYTRDWFESAFAEYFQVMEVHELEPNRVLFVGRLKQRSAGKQLNFAASSSEMPTPQILQPCGL